MSRAAIVVPASGPGSRMSDLLNDIAVGTRNLDFTGCVDFDWDVPVCLDDFARPGASGDMPSFTFSFRGAGSLRSVLHRTYRGDRPALYARSCWATPFNIQGVTWIEDAGNTAPMVSLAYADRWLWHNASVMGGGTVARGLELGVGGTLTARQLVQGYLGADIPVPGLASEFHIGGRSEFIECGGEGLYAFGARNFSIGDRTSFEWNGQADKGAAELLLEANPAARCGHGVIMNVAFENNRSKAGLSIRGIHRGMHVGANRFCNVGMDASCDDSCWYPNVVYYDAPLVRRGERNRWIGRRQQLVGPWYARRLEDEDESTFDLRLPLDGSGT